MVLRRDISAFGLMFVSVSAIIGSGWLFGSLYAAQMAGPAAIFSWILGGLAVTIVAFCFSELSSLFPVAGGIGVFPLFSHGTTVSFINSFISWIAFIIIAPIEIQAVIQYSTNYFPSLMIKVGDAQHLTFQGYLLALFLLIILTLINVLSVKAMSKTNFILTLWKLLVPILVIVFFFKTQFHLSNLTAHGGFMPFGFHGIFSSLAIGGIMLAFNGFQPGVALAGETKNPKKNIPIAVIGSLFICTLIYCLLQLSFLTALPKPYLLHGWNRLSFTEEAGPIAGLSIILGLVWLSKALYLDALVSPMATATVFYATAARSSYSMSKMEFLPKFFGLISKNGVPVYGVIFNFCISVLIFFTFTGWQEMVAFYGASVCLCNACIPLTLLVVRKKAASFYNSEVFKVPFYTVFCFLAFYISNLMLFWCGWNMIWRLDIAIFIGLFFVNMDAFLNKRHIFPNLKSSSSFFTLIFLMSILSKCGSYGKGLNLFGTKLELIMIFILSILVIFISEKTHLSEEEIKNNIVKNCPPEPQPESYPRRGE